MMVRVYVGVKDIKQGRALAAMSCPIARAASRAMGSSVSVGYNSLFTVGMWNTLKDKYVLPQKARTFIERFDKGKKVKPFSFRISPTSIIH
jgi:hypothetical protein